MSDAATTAAASDPPVALAGERESGLRRTLGRRQITMVGLGGAIGTGLFLGSSIAIHYAGPAVLVSYLIAALLAVVMVFSLSEMAVVHPVAGSFGTYAEIYLGACAGFVVRATYLATQVLVIGSEAVAVGTYLTYWFPDVGIGVFAVATTVAVGIINTRPVARFASLEYALTAIKVAAIVLFIVVGLARLGGLSGPSPGLVNFTGLPGGFAPHGLAGIWMATLAAVFSFLGIEFGVATAGEARDPGRAIPAALSTMALRLCLFYGLGLTVLIGVLPWTAAGTAIVTESPFVRMYAAAGIPAAASLMNAVVTVAAFSAMNTSLYLSSRMLYSLARAGDAPSVFGKLSRHDVPGNATLLATAAVLAATLLAWLTPGAYNLLFGISLFGGVFVWLAILVSHQAFRRRHRAASLPLTMPGYPYVQWAGIAVLGALLATMAWDDGFWRVAPLAGVPWVLALVVTYVIRRRGRERRPA